MSRTRKTYGHLTDQLTKAWTQRSLKYCTFCGNRLCLAPATIDGKKSMMKCKGTHSSKRYSKLSYEDDDDDDG